MGDQIPGQMDIFDALADELNGEPTCSRAVFILETAKRLGWRENPYCSFVIRLTRDDAIPFYARWDLSFSPETGKRTWRFTHAQAANGQKLAYGDIKIYLNDPTVIHPEPPEEVIAQDDDPDQTMAGALETLKAAGMLEFPAADWTALRGGG